MKTLTIKNLTKQSKPWSQGTTLLTMALCMILGLWAHILLVIALVGRAQNIQDVKGLLYLGSIGLAVLLYTVSGTMFTSAVFDNKRSNTGPATLSDKMKFMAGAFFGPYTLLAIILFRLELLADK